MSLPTTEQRIELHEKGMEILECIKDCDNRIRTAKNHLENMAYSDFFNMRSSAKHNLEIAVKMKLRFMERYNKLQTSILYPEFITVNK